MKKRISRREALKGFWRGIVVAAGLGAAAVPPNYLLGEVTKHRFSGEKTLQGCHSRGQPGRNLLQ